MATKSDLAHLHSPSAMAPTATSYEVPPRASAPKVRSLAGEENTSPGVRFEHALQSTMRLDHLTPACLTPGELDAYYAGTLATQVYDHVRGCRWCGSLLELIAKEPPHLPFDPEMRSREPYRSLRRVLERGEVAHGASWSTE